MASGPITSWQIDGETKETVRDFILGRSKITADVGFSYEIKRHLLLGRKVIINLLLLLLLLSCFSSVQLCATLETAAHQAPPSLGFSLSQSVQFSHLVVSDSLRPHESQHARPPCPLPTPGVHPDSHTSSQWCHPAISSSVIPFSSCPQSLPASESSPMSQLFSWGGQSTGVSALASFLPKKSQG